MSGRFSLVQMWLPGVVVVAAAAMATYAVAAAAPKSTAPKWEYHCVQPPTAAPSEPSSAHEMERHEGKGGHTSEPVLNHLGSQGWELVAIDTNNRHYCFKRPLAP